MPAFDPTQIPDEDLRELVQYLIQSVRGGGQ
jgi:hypothetical protein